MNLPAMLESAAQAGPGLRISAAGRAHPGSQLSAITDRRPFLHPPGSGSPARAGPVARRNHCQRHGYRRGRHDGHALCHGVSGLAADLSAGPSPGESSAFCHGESDCRERRSSPNWCSTTSPPKTWWHGSIEIIPDGPPADEMIARAGHREGPACAGLRSENHIPVERAAEAVFSGSGRETGCQKHAKPCPPSIF